MTAFSEDGPADEDMDGFIATSAALLGLELDASARESVREVLLTPAAHAARPQSPPISNTAGLAQAPIARHAVARTPR